MSDAAYAGERPDAAGPVAVRCLNGAGWRVVSTGLLPCDRAMLGAELRRLCGGADLVITVGGCGLSRWDCAPEAACDAGERAVPGLSVSLDGQELYLTPFVQRMLAGALDGMLRTLDGYHEGCEITLRMKSKT